MLKKDENLKKAGAYSSYDKWKKHRDMAIVATIAVAFLTLPLIWPIHVLTLAREIGWLDRFAYVGQYFADLGAAFLSRDAMAAFLKGYYGDWFRAVWQGKMPPSAIWIGWVMLVAITAAIGLASNRHSRTPNIYGDTRWADQGDLDQMEARNLVGFAHKLFVVGKFRKKNKFGAEKPELIRMGETLSLLLLAPPGTGKSVGFIVPSGVSMDQASLFFHDQKPELFDMTSGHRASIGPVFKLQWSAQDEPNGMYVTDEQAKLVAPSLLERDEKGELVRDGSGRIKTKPIFYPSWNPLSPKSIPAPGPKRDMYIERLANVLCPDSGNDKFWTSKARAALIGLVHFLVAKVEHAADPGFGGTWKGIPEQWHGREASFPMLVDWFAYAQVEFDDGSEDPMRQLFKASIDEARKMDEDFNKKFGLHVLNRAIIELTNLMNSPDKTRGSILQTVDEALGPFKNEAVRQRTSNSDFAFSELRGMPTAEAKAREQEKVEAARKEGKTYKATYKREDFRPVTIYISVNQEDAKALATITGIFVDSANSYLVANGPNAIDDQGNQLGPLDFVFLLDEAPQLPKLDTVMQGPAVGRSKRISYVIVGQDFAQFEQKYSKADVETLKSTTAIKIVLSQNNEATATAISKMAGKTTVKKYSYSEKAGGGGKSEVLKGPILGNLADIGGKKMSASESFEGIDFLQPAFIQSMPQDKHIVLVQNFMNRPIFCDTPKFFLEPDLAKKVYNLRTFEGPPPTTPMPTEWMKTAARNHQDRQKQTEAVEEKREALNDPRRVIIATPRDIQALTRNEEGEMADLGTQYGCVEIFVKDGDGFVEPPAYEKIRMMDSIEDVAAFVGKSRFYVFDETTLETEINTKLREIGQSGLSREFAEFIAARAAGVGESGTDIYFLGYQGGPSLDLPEHPSKVTPQFAIQWITEIIQFILGIEEQKRMFDL